MHDEFILNVMQLSLCLSAFKYSQFMAVPTDLPMQKHLDIYKQKSRTESESYSRYHSCIQPS